MKVPPMNNPKKKCPNGISYPNFKEARFAIGRGKGAWPDMVDHIEEPFRCELCRRVHIRDSGSRIARKRGSDG